MNHSRKPGLRQALPALGAVAAGCAVLATLWAAAWAATQAWTGWQARQAGARLFDGRTPLVAQVQGHDLPLPASAARCVNCHGAQADANGPNGPNGPNGVNSPTGVQPAGTGLAAATAATASRLAPELSASLLRNSLSRRGGPPSRYDAASLCHLLRTGIDPAWVLLPRSMPRYQISDSDCARLWAHLSA